jgi:ankyrin repeat protein
MRNFDLKKLVMIIVLLISGRVYSQDSDRLQKFLREAIDGNNIDKINMYLDAGVNLNTRWDIKVNGLDGKGVSPLIYTLSLKKNDLAKLLLEKGADPNFSYLIHVNYYVGGAEVYSYKDVSTNNLKECIKLNNEIGVKLLLDHGANRNSAVDEAKMSRNMNIVNLFKDLYVYSVGDLNNAIESGKSDDYIKDILKSGTKPDAHTLRSAVSMGKIWLIDSIIESGINVNQRIYLQNGAEWCATCEAVSRGNLNVLKYLLEEKGADINARCQIKSQVENSYSSLIKLAERNTSLQFKNIVEYLLLAPSIINKNDEEKAIQVTSYLKNGEEYLKNNDLDGARNEYDKAYQLTKNRYHKFENAAILFFSNQLNYSKVVELSKLYDSEMKNSTILVNTAFAHVELKNDQEALKYLDRCAELWPDTYWTSMNYAEYYGNIEDFVNTEKYLHKALDLGYKDWNYIEQSKYLETFRNRKEYTRLVKKYR